MTIIRVDLVPEFLFGDDVVLVAMNSYGVTTLAAVLKDAAQQGSSRLELDDVTHEFLIESGQSDIEIDVSRVVWKLDRTKADEVIKNLRVLERHNRPGHQYVDIIKPTDTLVLSLDEYVKPSSNERRR